MKWINTKLLMLVVPALLLATAAMSVDALDDLSVPSAIDPPTLWSPLNGAVDVPLSTVLMWSPVAGADRYNWQVATDLGFTDIIADGNVPKPPLSFTTDLEGTTLYWRVQGVAGGVAGPMSVPFNFTTVVTAPPVPTPFAVDQWGALGSRLEATGWTLDNDADTPAGDVFLSGDVMSSNWTAVRGGFGGTLTATMDEALKVSGQFEIVGGEVGEWNPFRWGLFNHPDVDELMNQYSDSALWGNTENGAFVSNEANAFGYLVTAQTGSEGPVGGNGGSGSAWAVNGGSWISTFSGGTLALGSPNEHAPRRAVMPAGTYDFAMSVQPLGDGSTELRWYIFNVDGESYWHGGMHVDTTAQKTQFNGIAFSFRPEVEGITGINLYGVTVDFGDPIEIPQAPFSAFYLDEWGALGTRLAATGWTLDNDSTTLVGDAYLSGDGMSSNWTAIRGGFGGTQSATLDEALIVKGQFEIIGGEVGEWNPFRWGLFNHPDVDELMNQYSDSALWGNTENPGTDSAAFVSNEANAFGYLVTAQTGSEGPVGGNGGSGSAWAVNGGSWISTFSGGTLALGSPFEQAPRRAIMPEGTYDFAMSVQPLADGSTEVRWYIFNEDGQSYWHAGTHIDTTAQKSEFNGFAFSYRPEVEGITGINLYAVQIDRGDPIDIPEAPFSAFYLDEWGALGTRLEATGWTLDNDSTTLVGDAYLSGDGMSSNWTAIRSGFGGTQSATLDEALIVSGQFEIIGGEVGEWNPFRWGLFNHPDVDELMNQYTDSALWGNTVNPGTDSAAFVSNEANALGYLVTAQTGSEGPVGGNGGSGSAWAVNGGSWISTFSGGTVTLGSSNDHAPRRAIMPEGTYDFAMSVQPLADGSTEVRWYIFNEDEESYWHAGTHVDTTAQKSEFNGFAFSFRPEVEGITGINLYAVQIDRGDPIEIPAAPFSAFYPDQWGFLGGKFGGAVGDTSWALTPGEFVGDVAIGGDAATDWAVVAGSFGSLVTPVDQAVVITADVTFEGGGFEADGSFRFGLFNMSLGSLDSTDAAGYVWTGAETGNGYLFIPGAGTAWASGEMGTAGGVVGGAWYDPMGAGAYGIGGASASGTPVAGTYELKIAVAPNTGTGKKAAGNNVRASLTGNGYTYEAVVINDSDAPAATSFNAIAFGTNNSTTTGLTIEALQVDEGEFSPVANEDLGEGTLPVAFALEQNYPNPFNPSTNIRFSLPQAVDVQLVVYNMLGQRVMTLVNKEMQAGFHQVAFDASSLASGIYVYRIEAADFVSTRKMILVE